MSVVRSLLIAAVAAAGAFQASADSRDHWRERDDGQVDRTRDDGDGQGRQRFVQRDHDRARDGVMSGRLLPLEAVLANIARVYPGTHIGVEGPYQQGGRWVYRIKWLTPDGRVIIIFADAETGQILGQRGGR